MKLILKLIQLIMRILYIPKPVSLITPIKYGLYYNWWAATHINNIANIGWKTPIEAEWNTLKTYLGTTNAGNHIRLAGTTYWNAPNTGADNSSGFSAKGSGFRSSTFQQMGAVAYFWTATQSADPNAGMRMAITAINPSIYNGGNSKYDGMVLRLLKETTILTHGQTGTYTGNDGKVYPTICIGAQEWMANNLAETKYRNGDLIPEVTGNAAWQALTTGAMCAYNNDWTNV